MTFFSWQWNFGDGSPVSNEKDPSHTYAEVGTYTVSLKVTGPLGSDTETKTDYITVTCPIAIHTISGYILAPDGLAVEGVSVEADNCGGSDTTDADGYYEILVPENWSGMVTPYKTDHIFYPHYMAYTRRHRESA